MCDVTLHKYAYSFGSLLYSGIVKETKIKKSPSFLQEIEKVQKYDTPINPHIMFPNFTAPQSFCYVDSEYTD